MKIITYKFRYQIIDFNSSFPHLVKLTSIDPLVYQEIIPLIKAAIPTRIEEPMRII